MTTILLFFFRGFSGTGGGGTVAGPIERYLTIRGYNTERRRIIGPRTHAAAVHGRDTTRREVSE